MVKGSDPLFHCVLLLVWFGDTDDERQKESADKLFCKDGGALCLDLVGRLVCWTEGPLRSDASSRDDVSAVALAEAAAIAVVRIIGRRNIPSSVLTCAQGHCSDGVFGRVVSKLIGWLVSVGQGWCFPVRATRNFALDWSMQGASRPSYNCYTEAADRRMASYPLR